MPNRSTTGRRALAALALSITAGVALGAPSPAGAAGGCTVKRGTGARDTLIGTRGHDCLRARAGADAIRSRSGRDVIRAGAGNDTVWTRDGQSDVVRCGPGYDKALVDRHDVVRSCERIVRPKRGGSGTHSSPPPAPVQRTLQVSVSGAGTGTVTGPGISCPGDCSQSYSDGTRVSLNASATGGSSFDGWSGTCSGSGDCQLTMDSGKSAAAEFGQGSPPPPPPSDSCGWGTFGPSNEPGACWRPYADSSPWNTPVGAHPSIASNSDAIVHRLLGFGAIRSMTTGESGTALDWEHPVYWSKPSDPLYTLHFEYKGADGLYHQVNWGPSAELQGAQIHIPADAQAASGSDHHLTVIDQSTGWEYSMYFEHTINLPPNGGDITAIGGGRENVITGDGRGVDATAGYFPAGAGDIRPAEIQQGQINHALFIEVYCTDVGNVYPADTGSTWGQELGSTRKCHSAGLPDANAPHNGQHFYLDYTDAEIDALPVSDWKKTILRAMAHYGLYVGDTGGSPWGLKFESGSSWTSFGLEDHWVTLAQRWGLPTYTDKFGRRVYSWNMASGVDWSRLRVVAP